MIPPSGECFFVRIFSFLKTDLRYPQAAVINSPPNVALRCGARQLALGKSFQVFVLGSED
jgi:hypothetical protein